MNTIKISELDTSFRIRETKEQNINKLIDTMKIGYLKHYPILIDNNNVLIDGHHRVEACKKLGITEIPYIQDKIPPKDRVKIAVQANEASENSIPMTMVDYCELIWNSEEKLADIALSLGWSEAKTKQYSALQKVTPSAWQIVVTNLSSVTEEVTNVTFTEGILRHILKLADSQQLELVTDLANGTINKNKFKVLAEKYRKQNEDIEKVTKALKNKVSDELLTDAIEEVEKGNYNLEKLIQLTLDKHDKKTSIKLIHGDFYEEVKNIQKESIDLIITDPPYNIAHEKKTNYSKNGRSDISKDFGEWDKVEHKEFIDTFKQWAKEFYSILKPHRACFVWTSDIYISHLSEAFKQAGFKHKSTITWHKTNPGTSQMKDNFINSNEYCLYFIKDSFNKEKSVLNWFGEVEMQNFISGAICGGNERLKDSKGNVLHPTQKPEYVIKYLIDIASNKGDVVFDGFSGSGTTASVCKKTDRRFKGIESDLKYYEASLKRVNNG